MSVGPCALCHRPYVVVAGGVPLCATHAADAGQTVAGADEVTAARAVVHAALDAHMKAWEAARRG